MRGFMSAPAPNHQIKTIPDYPVISSKLSKALPYKEKRLERRGGDGAQPSTVSKRAWSCGIQRPLWPRGAMPCGADRDALAGRLRVPQMQRAQAELRQSSADFPMTPS